ncbi:hypothetical protein OS493_019129 [Desmophyllum pertusum]|uniref:Uncharacterized protein n=1 Tax=Desmophyllum pertusum TaxID=174260 RepID=A0A9X0CJS7_9CNID|nr:hypothetical protein OS493_019129 [Desmophyllum pertusum]
MKLNYRLAVYKRNNVLIAIIQKRGKIYRSKQKSYTYQFEKQKYSKCSLSRRGNAHFHIERTQLKRKTSNLTRELVPGLSEDDQVVFCQMFVELQTPLLCHQPFVVSQNGLHLELE